MCCTVVMYCQDAASYERAVSKSATSGSIVFPLADLPDADEELAAMERDAGWPLPAGAPISLPCDIRELCATGRCRVVQTSSRCIGMFIDMC